ncbi:hypothetical protein CBS101457_006674 [Exobasidium rhododendri]|nr:hypothetical protein CBS101457_006674 [Exobasidium rhododendri]
MEAKSLAAGSVASRFVSQTQLTEAQKKREEDIRAAYARMGQSPPPEALEAKEVYDPRTLYEKLQSQKDAKQEAFDDKLKLSNQFRGIDDAESEFLAEIAKERQQEQWQREREMRLELDEFRKAALARESSPPGAVGAVASTSKTEVGAISPIQKTGSTASKTKNKRKREGLLGVVKKKAPTSSTSETSTTQGSKSTIEDGKITPSNDDKSVDTLEGTGARTKKVKTLEEQESHTVITKE